MVEKHLTPIKAIRAHCLDCMAFQPNEVKLCPSEGCALWPYRMGHNPNIRLSEAERERRAQRGRDNAANLRNRQGE